MGLNDFTAAPTATTFHGVEISRSNKVDYSPAEKIQFSSHIVKHQLTKNSEDLHLNELHQALGIANMGKKYTEIIYPRIENALKSRIRELRSSKECRPSLKGVVENGRERFYPKFMDAWAEPHWQGNMVKPPEQSDQVEATLPPQPSTPHPLTHPSTQPSVHRSCYTPAIHRTPIQPASTLLH